MNGRPLSVASYRIGEAELIPLLDGAQALQDPLEESFPSVPPEAWAGVRSAYPDLVSPAGTWRLHVRCTLVRLPGKAILVDTGVGRVLSPAWFGAKGRLLDELAHAGLGPEAIDTVVLTHVHDDHIGGTVTEAGRVAFPEARFVLQRADFEWQREWAGREDEDRVLFDTLLRPLEVGGALMLVDGPVRLAEGVHVRPAPGHTPGHQVVEIHGGEERALISGDAFNHPVQLAEPDWFGGSDSDPDTAGATRRTILEQVVAEGVLLAPSHFAQPFGRVRVGDDGRAAWRAL